MQHMMLDTKTSNTLQFKISQAVYAVGSRIVTDNLPYSVTNLDALEFKRKIRQFFESNPFLLTK